MRKQFVYLILVVFAISLVSAISWSGGTDTIINNTVTINQTIIINNTIFINGSSNDSIFNSTYARFAYNSTLWKNLSQSIAPLSVATNVTIATTNESEALTVGAGVDITGGAYRTSDNGLALSFETYGGRIQTYLNRPLILNGVGNRVGIGTNVPSTILEVVGTVNATRFNASSDFCIENGKCLSTTSVQNDTIFNSTYAMFAYNQSTFVLLQIANQNASWISTYNATYDALSFYAYNQSTIVFTQISNQNGSWISTFNSTYALFAYNQSLGNGSYNYNETLIANAYTNLMILNNITQINANILANQSLKADSIWGYNQSAIVFTQISNQNGSWISTFNSTYDALSLYAYNQSAIVFTQIANQNASWISTFNATYALFAYNQTNLSFYNQSYALRTELNANISQINANILANQSLKADVIWGYNQTTISNAYTDLLASQNNASWISTFNSTYALFAYNQTGGFGYNQTIASGWNFSALKLFPTNLLTNVSIGIANPEDRLQVYGGQIKVNDTIGSTGTNEFDASILIERTNSGTFLGARQIGGARFFIYVDGSNIYYRSPTTNGLNFGTSNADQLYIRGSNGNIGIRTSTPQEQLSIVGNLSVTENLTVGNELFVNKRSVGIGQPNPTAELDVKGNLTVSENLTVSNFFFVLPSILSKKIGIGTPNPNAIVDIQPNGLTPFILTLGTQLGINYTFSSPLPLAGAGAGNLRITDDVGTQYLTFENNSGNVGIGNQQPLERLHVTGNERVTQNITINGLKIFNSTKGSSLDSCTLASGTCNIYNPSINQASSVIFCEGQSGTLNVGTPQVSARNASGYTVTSSNVLDARWVACIVVYPV